MDLKKWEKGARTHRHRHARKHRQTHLHSQRVACVLQLIVELTNIWEMSSHLMIYCVFSCATSSTINLK